MEGDVPEVLSGVTILGLDMGALEAGAGVKGEFENRLRGVINEIKASTTPILLFIDEAHTLIGAGGSAGTNDAANLLKPALARGELRTIAATTWSEYKKYFEKDPALARRFELVKLDEPSVEMSVQILRGLKDKYEDVHRVIIRDDALHAAAELSDKYITGRQLPDKAIDLLDTACARIKVNLSSKPDFIEDCERELQMLAREKRGLLRDQDNRIVIDGKRLVEIDEQTSKLENNLQEMHEKFEAQLSAAKQVLELRKNLIAAKAEVNDETTQTVAETERLLGDAEKQFEALQSTEKLVFIDVSPDTIAKVVSDRTGVPLGKMMRDQAASALTMESSLEARIKGQDEAMQAIAQVMKSARSGLRDPDQPMGIF
ncbi:MAG: AAA family ATPase, partial [Burkholderiaceae bacterium]|nr:AAA family ATPase [Burkholderiaceae bacterium]